MLCEKASQNFGNISWKFSEILSTLNDKQPLEMLCKRSCSEKFGKFHRKTIVLESYFNKVADLKACSFVKKWLQHRCFPMNIAKFLRTAQVFLYRTPPVLLPPISESHNELLHLVVKYSSYQICWGHKSYFFANDSKWCWPWFLWF